MVDDKFGKRESGNQIKCEKCGKLFIPKQPHHKTCSQCHFSSTQQKANVLSTELLLNTYYDTKGNLLKEVFINIPEQLANIFANSRPELATKQLRDFYQIITRARNKAILKGIAIVRPILYECQRNIEYQLKRKIIPETFAHFMKYHLSIAEKDEGNLEGFCQHLESVVAYFPKEKGG